MKVFYGEMLEANSLQVENQKNQPKTLAQTLVDSFVNFWRFSSYYAEYKACSRED